MLVTCGGSPAAELLEAVGPTGGVVDTGVVDTGAVATGVVGVAEGGAVVVDELVGGGAAGAARVRAWVMKSIDGP
ncbi:MAG TPA: hypothetical protein VI248_23190, partial [Kineosporiaceae bacterium]